MTKKFWGTAAFKVEVLFDLCQKNFLGKNIVFIVVKLEKNFLLAYNSKTT